MDDTSADEIPETLVITLDPPIEVNKALFAELSLREPTLSQVRDAHMKLDDAGLPSIGAQREYELAFVAAVSGKPRIVVDALPVRVLREAVGYLESWVKAPLLDVADEIETRLTVELSPPLKGPSGGEVHELVLREPTGGEMRKAEDLLGKQSVPLPGPVRRYQARLIELVAGVSPWVVGQLPISKSKEAIRFLEGFERSAQATGTR